MRMWDTSVLIRSALALSPLWSFLSIGQEVTISTDLCEILLVISSSSLWPDSLLSSSVPWRGSPWPLALRNSLTGSISSSGNPIAARA